MALRHFDSLSDLGTGDGRVPALASWSREDLVRRTRLALSIATRAIDVLGRGGYRDEQAPQDSFGPDKPLAETAMLLYVAAAVAGQIGEEPRVTEVAALMAPHARSRRTAWAVALHPTILWQLAMPHILLRQLGLVDPGFDRLVTLSVGSLARSGREVVPHRALEAMWLEALWSGTPPGAEFDAAAVNSVMNHPLDLLWGDREDAYARTHTFMYFTDFGYARRPLPRSHSEILEESAALLARSLLLEDFDLAAEVLMSWPLTASPWPAAAAFGFRVLAELEDKVGFLPAGNGVPEKFDRLQGSERTQYALAASYHTAYVMGMLCSLSLRPGNAPPHVIGGPLAPVEVVSELTSLLQPADTPWQHTFRGLQPVEQRALAPFLLDMALLSAVRKHDFAAAGNLLAMAARTGLANSPLCAQTAQLLQRLVTCAEHAIEATAPRA